MSQPFLETIGLRRSNYALTSDSPISDSKIEEIIGEVLLKAPSGFNTQTTRIVLLLNNEHRQLWDIAAESLKEKIGAERFEKESKEGLEGYKKAHGTV